jgi:uncharacterized protein YjbI with pentapeptide repeats
MHHKIITVSLFSCAFVAIAAAQQKDFHDKDLSGKSFNAASLNNADFSDAVLQHCDFYGASLKKANFNGADLKNCGLAKADLTGADLRGISQIGFIDGTILNEANLEGVDMQACGSIYGCKFRKANLRNTKGWKLVGACDFSGADLRGANFRAMVPDSTARFSKAIYDEETTWPDGFDPQSVGAVLAKADAAKDESSSSETKTKPPTKAMETKAEDAEQTKTKPDGD